MHSYKAKTVFISGSAHEYGRFWDYGKDFIRQLTRALLNNGFKIISGFGLGVGNHVADEALGVIYEGNKEEITDCLQVFPFPSAGYPEKIHRYYRNYMLSKAGIVIFLFGNKLEDITLKEADGMLKEFEIARSNQSLLIPVGISGYASKKIWNEVVGKFDEYFETREKYELFLELGNPYTHPGQLINIIMQLTRTNAHQANA